MFGELSVGSHRPSMGGPYVEREEDKAVFVTVRPLEYQVSFQVGCSRSFHQMGCLRSHMSLDMCIYIYARMYIHTYLHISIHVYLYVDVYCLLGPPT